MYFINCSLTSQGIEWQYGPQEPSEEKGLLVSFSVFSSPLGYSPKRYEILKFVEHTIKEKKISWITCRVNEWQLDLDKLKNSFTFLLNEEWLKGKVEKVPDFEASPKEAWLGCNYKGTNYIGLVFLHITPETLTEAKMIGTPHEIRESLESFRKDFPGPSKVAFIFIMMDFSDTEPHKKIKKVIEKSLLDNGIVGVRSDHKAYHDDLFPNVKTYIHGCNFGVAVFERITGDLFNPNVALEVGYMMALGKPVCLLKDKTIKVLQADLIGKLYKEFDPHDPEGTIPSQITKWLKDKGLIQ